MSIEIKKPTWPLLLFSLPFLSVGIGFLLISILPTLYLAIVVPQWDRVPATILSTNLEVSYGDGTTYQAVAQYKYQINNQDYVNDKVGFSRGNDNIGQWQSNAYQLMLNAQQSNEPMMAFVHPKRPEKSYLFADLRWGLLGMKMIFVVVFGGVGGAAFISAFIKFPTQRIKTKASSRGRMNASQSDHIYSSTRTIFWSYLIIGVLVAAISSPALFSIIEEWESGNKLILLALIFPLVAVGFLFAALKEGFRILKFGRSPLIMKPYPASVGGHLGATVQVNSPYVPNQKFQVSLNCVNRVTTRSGGKSKTHEHNVWHDEGFAFTERAPNGKTRLRFAFNLPSSVSETSEPSNNYYFWRLDLNATLSGQTFKRSFRVPVQKTPGAEPTQQYLADQHPLMDQLIDERIERLNINQQGYEFTYTIPRFAYPYERLGGVVFGGVFIASGIGASLGGAPFIFPLLFVPIGSLIAIGSLKAYLTAAYIRISPNGVSRLNSVIGLFKKAQHIKTSELASFKISQASTWKNSQGPSRHYYAIHAHGEQKQKIEVIDRVEGRDSAEVLCERFNNLINT